MYCFIFGFQRLVWCPKWTPASSRSFNAIPFKVPPLLTVPVPAITALPFAELEALARALLSVLLAFLDARVARQEAFLLQSRPQFEVVFHQRPRNAQAQRSGLAGDAAARDGGEYIEFIGRFGHGHRLLDLVAVS